MANIKLLNDKTVYKVKEAYYTVKKRLFDANLFLELTMDNTKIVLNKSNIESLWEDVKKTKIAQVKKTLKNLSK